MKSKKATPRRVEYFTAAVLFFTLLLGATGQGLAAEKNGDQKADNENRYAEYTFFAHRLSRNNKLTGHIAR